MEINFISSFNKMLKSIIDYVKYHYQFCENIESFFLTNNLEQMNVTSKVVWFINIFLNTISKRIFLCM